MVLGMESLEDTKKEVATRSKFPQRQEKVPGLEILQRLRKEGANDLTRWRKIYNGIDGHVLHVSSGETHVAYALEQVVAAGAEDGSGARWQMCGWSTTDLTSRLFDQKWHFRFFFGCIFWLDLIEYIGMFWFFHLFIVMCLFLCSLSLRRRTLRSWVIFIGSPNITRLPTIIEEHIEDQIRVWNQARDCMR